MDTPLVTVIVATYNRERYIPAAISSVQKQTYQNWELIVIDDASTDNTRDIIAAITKNDPRVRYIRQKENVGIARNRNTGLDDAQGTYVAILDSDDIWTDPDKLKKQVAFLGSHPDHAMVGTWIRLIDAQGEATGFVRYETDDIEIRKKILFRNQFAQSSLMYRADVVQKLGGYDPTYTVIEDYDMWLKVGQNHKFANIPEYTIDYRIHQGSITIEKRLLAADEHIRIIRAYKKSYPCYPAALAKGYLRMLLAFVGL